MKKKNEFHLHINHFGRTLPASLAVLRDTRGFVPTLDLLKEETGTNPLWIVTKKLHADAEAHDEFNDALALLRKDAGMYGYMECELVTDGSIARYKETPYDVSRPFPLKRPTFVQATRGADIHIFRDLQTPYDELDVRLKDVGFYEVTTDDERIWTFLMESAEDAEHLLQAFKAHFDVAGGISKIEKEVVQMLETSPSSFVLKQVARSGFLRA